jgi:hypothetical protein
MAGSTSNLDLIATAQAQKEVTANAMFDAMSPASLFGRRASACVALTWAYYGGVILVSGAASDNLLQIANGTIELDASATNYVEADGDGVVSSNTSGFTPGSVSLYEVVTGAAAVTSYTDWRISVLGAAGDVDSVNGQTGVVVLDAGDIDADDPGGYFTTDATTVGQQLQEIGADLAAIGGGDALTANPLSQFAATTSAQLAGIMTDETGSGALVFGTSPTLVTPALGTPSALVLTNATGLPVAGGGTGVASLTAYAPIFGGTSGTGAVQSGTVGTAGQVLTSNGAGAIPTFEDATGGAGSVDVQTFTADGTWTKPAGCTLVEVVVIGAGGGGGGGAGQANGTRRDGGGGGGGGARHPPRVFKASDLAGTVAVTVGVGGANGTGGSTGNGTVGSAGTASSFGDHVVAYGGGGGGPGTSTNVSGGGGGGSAGVGANGSGSNVAGGLPGSVAAAHGVGGQGGGSTAFSVGSHAEYGGGGGGGDNGNGGASMFGGGGGGGGGALSNAQSPFPAKYGGATNGVYAHSSSGTPNNAGIATGGSAGANGGNGTAGDSTRCGSGGGGGDLNTAGTGGTGGDGGAPGGGGGGGGCGTSVGGPGGDGARGEVRVYSW